MKYLAILKDSLREAIDAKVLYVMLGLSGLLILVALSLSFRPFSVEESVKKFRDSLNWVMSFQPPGTQVHFEYADYHQSQAEEPWKADYRFTIVAEYPDAGTATGEKGSPFGPHEIKSLLRQGFGSYLDKVSVEETAGSNPKERRFVVTSHGTKVDNLRGWNHEPSLLFGLLPLHLGPVSFEGPLGMQVFIIENWLVNGIGGWVAILTGIVITAFFIPNMLRKGTVDLLLVKPIHRVTLLVFKYLGGLTFMLVLAGFTVLGVWLALGLRSGIWATGFLLTIFVLTFAFAILYAVSTLFGVLTRSPIVAILMTALVWGVLLGINWLYVPADQEKAPKKVQTEVGEVDEERVPPAMRRGNVFPEWVYATVRVLHFGLPRTTDLNTLTSRLIMKGVLLNDNPRLEEMQKVPFSWAESLGVSGAFIAVMLALAGLRFATADY